MYLQHWSCRTQSKKVLGAESSSVTKLALFIFFSWQGIDEESFFPYGLMMIYQ